MNDDASIVVRVAVAADAAALAEFASRTFEETFGSQNRPEDLQAHLKKAFGIPQQSRELSNPDMVTLLAYHESLVAFAQVLRQAPPEGIVLDHPVELHRFYVDRPAHGTGVAQRLMRGVHAAAHSFGGRNLWLGVWERNARAISFYRKAGFVDCGSHDFFVGADRQTDRVFVAPVRADDPGAAA